MNTRYKDTHIVDQVVGYFRYRSRLKDTIEAVKCSERQRQEVNVQTLLTKEIGVNQVNQVKIRVFCYCCIM